MLTVEETRWSLRAFQVYSMLNFLPIGVDVKSGRIQNQRRTNPVKCFIWKMLFGVGVCHWLFMFVRLLQSAILDPEKYFRWDHFVFNFGTVGFYSVIYFAGFCLFVKSPQETVMIFNQLFKEREDPVRKIIRQNSHPQIQVAESGTKNKNENKNGGKKIRTNSKSATSAPYRCHERNDKAQNEANSPENQPQSESDSPPKVVARQRPLLTWPPQYSLDELLAKLLPLLLVVTGVFIMLILGVDPTRPQLLYSILPPEWQNWASFTILLAVEALCYAVVAFTAGFAIVTQVLFFSKCQLEFKRMFLQLRNLEEKFQNGAQNGVGPILCSILGEMRELVVLIELFNRCFPFCIFACKISFLSMSILFYFFVIRHFGDFPMTGLFIGYGAILLTLMYIIMYGHAFSIPGKMDDLKEEFLLTAQKTTSSSNANSNSNSTYRKNLRAELKRQIRGIRGVGIKVGSFHQMERQSTPNFVDFVLRNVVSLLVTFPR